MQFLSFHFLSALLPYGLNLTFFVQRKRESRTRARVFRVNYLANQERERKRVGTTCNACYKIK